MFRPSRPGLIGAIAIISIVLGALSLLRSCGGVGQSALMLFIQPVMRSAMTASRAPGASPGLSSTMIQVPPSADAQTTIDALAALEPITPAQRQQLVALFNSRGDWILAAPDPGKTWDLEQAKKMVETHGQVATNNPADRAFFFTTKDGRVELHDQFALFRDNSGASVTSAFGQSGNSRTLSMSTKSPNASSSATVTTSGTFPIIPTFARGPLILTGIESLLSLFLAIFLMTIGIMVLRDSRRGLRLHWTFVWLKIPLVLLGAIASWWSMSSMMLSTPGTAGMSVALATGVAIGSITWSLMGLVYPIGLIFALQSQTVRHWMVGD